MAPNITLEQLPITDLQPYPRNAKTHPPAQVKAIARSIQEFGFTNPILIDTDGTILAGHGRVLAAQSLGMETVPAIRLDHLTHEQARAYILADNRLAEAPWDVALLSGELEALNGFGFDLSLTGFEKKEIDNLLAGWESHVGAADAIEPRDDGMKTSIKVLCAPDDELEVRSWLRDILDEAPGAPRLA